MQNAARPQVEARAANFPARLDAHECPEHQSNTALADPPVEGEEEGEPATLRPKWNKSA
jgi:hypothetical protein